ncbi:MAG: maleylpyruvate isomerase family mycothiol-dependent enzyme [Marmoricola sp.]
MLPVEDCLAAITAHTRGLAAAAEGNLDARVEHCPDWSVGDLVWHLASVHWFWENVARLRPSTAPEDLERPGRPADEDLVATLLTNMSQLVDTLRASDQNAACWTWGLEENIGFITRHQVQEAAVHHWDAVNATRSGSWEMDPAVAADAVDEFLTHSVANRRWPEKDAAPLGGTIAFDPWRISDGAQPGTLTHEGSGSGSDVITGRGTASDFLLWLYRRIDDPCSLQPWHGDSTLLERFRAFTNTD